MKVSDFTAKKNAFGQKFTSLKAREEFLINKLDRETNRFGGVKPPPPPQKEHMMANAINNWERDSDGSKIWSF